MPGGLGDFPATQPHAPKPVLPRGAKRARDGSPAITAGEPNTEMAGGSSAGPSGVEPSSADSGAPGAQALPDAIAPSDGVPFSI
eukprot:7700761-Lingulodinium_polyedra.AAC.1